MTGGSADPAWLTLLERILDRVPKLDGAACARPGVDPRLFDPAGPNEPPAAVAARHTAAQSICAGCPALDDCAAWLDTFPKRPPRGVVAGRRPRIAGRPATDATTDRTAA